MTKLDTEILYKALIESGLAEALLNLYRSEIYSNIIINDSQKVITVENLQQKNS